MDTKSLCALEDATFKITNNRDTTAIEYLHATLWFLACRYRMLMNDRARKIGLLSTFMSSDGDFTRKLAESDMGWYDTQLTGYEKEFDHVKSILRRFCEFKNG